MPRIVPIQLLKCLKVLLDDNGGILSAGEVKRLASLMTKYSKKLVSKCIYVQILKCTKTELLDEFMAAGGWSLVYTWLNDAIRAMNWPLVQEILELLLLCPVDVHRLKINSAPKLVKGLCKDGGNEGVRILAKHLVEQWLKVVTENPEAKLPTTNMTPQANNAIKTPTVAVVAPDAISVNVQQQQQTTTMVMNAANQSATTNTQQQQKQVVEESQTPTEETKSKTNKKSLKKVQDFEEEEEEEEAEAEEQADEEEDEEEEDTSRENEQEDQDPLGGVDPQPVVTNYTLTPAQKKASESGLVYKFIIKDGQSILAKVPPKTTQAATTEAVATPADDEEEEETESNEVADEEIDEPEITEDTVDNAALKVTEVDDNSSSLDKTEKDNDSNSSTEDKTKVEETKKTDDKKSSTEEKDKSVKDRRSSKDKERRGSSSSIDKEKDKDREGKSSKSSSSSSSHRSSSHKSSSSSSKSSSSSSSKSKSSSSSSHRSSSDKHRSDKERSSSSKDKDKERSSSSSSKHRSSSSKSSSSSSSSSKDKHRDKEKSSSSSSSSSSSKSKDKSEQSDKDKSSSSSSSSTLDKLAKISKKSKEESESSESNKPTSITIPSKKASMSIEIRKDTEKTKTVKTYKSQFRSHGLTEEAPPPPSRKGLKKPSSTTPPGTVLPSSLPSSLKRTSPPPRDLPSEKKPKIDINNVSVANEKPGAIKLIPPKKIQTLVETNLFSDALSAATGPKKVTKRKRPNTPLVNGKDAAPSSPTSPDAPKVMPLKFYQDTLDEAKTEDSKSDKENEETNATTKSSDSNTNEDDKDLDDDDDIPLKKVKEDIEQKVAQEKKEIKEIGDNTDKSKDGEEEKMQTDTAASPSRESSPKEDENDVEMVMEKKPGPGCGPNGPPGVLMLHRRKGPKKKLTWRPQETLEQIRYFELDENERCNVTKTSFMDMKNMERFSERDAIVMARRGFNQEDNMEPQTHWKPLIEVDDVPPHPDGNQSKQRKIQAERELTTLRALYFTHALIPDSPAEAEFEPAFNHDVPLIPLEDLTGNPDAVNDFTSMPWPEPRGSPKQGDNGTGGLGSPVDMFGNGPAQMANVPAMNPKQSGGNPFNPFVSPFGGNGGPNGPNGPVMQNSPNQWQGPGNGPMGGPMGVNGPMMGNPFNGNHGSPIMDMGGPGPMGPGPMMNNGPQQNFMNQFSPNFGGPNNNPFMNGPNNFNNGPNNFGPMGPNGPMMNGMGPGPMGNNCPPQMMNGGGGGHNNRNNNRGNNNGGGNWRTGGSNFQDNAGGGGGGNWRPAGPGSNNRGGGGGGNNNGVCKAYMRGHCRLGNSCKYIHPNKSKRI